MLVKPVLGHSYWPIGIHIDNVNTNSANRMLVKPAFEHSYWPIGIYSKIWNVIGYKFSQ